MVVNIKEAAKFLEWLILEEVNQQFFEKCPNFPHLQHMVNLVKESQICRQSQQK